MSPVKTFCSLTMLITIEMVKEFRLKIGLSLLECKHYLSLANSDNITDKEQLYYKAIQLEFNSRKFRNVK